MSQSASQAHAFYKDVAKNGKVWTVKDDVGFPAPLKSDGSRAQPFWSSLSRVEKIIKSIPDYSVFEPYEIDLKHFLEAWLPGLDRDGILIGVNWSGLSATGYDLDSATVLEAIQFHMANEDNA